MTPIQARAQIAQTTALSVDHLQRCGDVYTLSGLGMPEVPAKRLLQQIAKEGGQKIEYSPELTVSDVISIL
ncbi:hypothetical protein CL632_02620 [bacterium]|jgi:hypothetical protein|nr:hypothetical protein [bacterium]|tara:strand:- start:35387 stop:35599 length:213 start_codon:yes stop_codon:yes gene_type:complete